MAIDPSKAGTFPVPLGFKLRHILKMPVRTSQVIWSPDGQILATCTDRIQFWHVESGQLLQTLNVFTPCIAWSMDGQGIVFHNGDNIGIWDLKVGHFSTFLDKNFSQGEDTYITWSPQGRMIATMTAYDFIALWNAVTGQYLRSLNITIKLSLEDPLPAMAWSPDEKFIITGYPYENFLVWELETGHIISDFGPNKERVNSLAWSPNGEIIASATNDRTIRLWSPKGWSIGVLETHTDEVINICFSPDGVFLASKSFDNTVRLWRTDIWEQVATLKEIAHKFSFGLAFNPQATILATLSEEEKVVHIWELDVKTILSSPSGARSSSHPNSMGSRPDGSLSIAEPSSVRYANAKVILVGDSGVGKSGLGLVLTDQPFAATESTHGRYVWTFDSQEVDLVGRKETRETLLWDLAGQPGYRLIHQLHLNEVAVALIVFDSRSETDPFRGVHHWVRALRLAQRTQSTSTIPMKKFLVVARVDRGGVGVSSERIKSLVQELGFDGFFETSAKEGWKITELAEAIRNAIDWEALPWVQSTELFQNIKAFLLAEKEAGRLLSTIDDLFHTFLRYSKVPLADSKDMRAQFETCIGLVESRDLIRRLSFGDLVLLQPELLDAYASALVNAVKDEPDGLGSIAEKRVQAGDFPVLEEQRLKNKAQEKLLLIAMIEDMLGNEIALREEADDGSYLVFPSQSTRENLELPDPEGRAVIFGFEGPVLNIYATLAVRLSHSGMFKKKEFWRNAVTYISNAGGTCGIFLYNSGEGRGELTLFFGKEASEETRFHFEEYIFAYLQRQALSESIQRRRLFSCSNCGFVLTNQLVQLLLQRGSTWLDCPVCHTYVSLLDREERLTTVSPSHVKQMNLAANDQRAYETSQSMLQGKIATHDFDVFLCHNANDKPAVRRIAEQLRERGILPWLDEEQLRPGLPWQRLLEQQIGQIKAAAVFVGIKGRSPWQDMELYAFLSQFVKRECPVIPIILPDCEEAPDLPIFLQSMTWVDFRKQNPNPMSGLIWGITGERVLMW